MILISKTLSSYDEQISAFYFATNKYFHDRLSYGLPYVTWPISPRNYVWKSKKVTFGLWPIIYGFRCQNFFNILEGATNVKNWVEGEQRNVRYWYSERTNCLKILNFWYIFWHFYTEPHIIGCHVDAMFLSNIKINFVIFEIVFISIETCLILFKDFQTSYQHRHVHHPHLYFDLP